VISDNAIMLDDSGSVDDGIAANARTSVHDRAGQDLGPLRDSRFPRERAGGIHDSGGFEARQFGLLKQHLAAVSATDTAHPDGKKSNALAVKSAQHVVAANDGDSEPVRIPANRISIKEVAELHNSSPPDGVDQDGSVPPSSNDDTVRSGMGHAVALIQAPPPNS
jgi:hypothetical protein